MRDRKLHLPYRVLLALAPLIITSCGGDGGGSQCISGPLCGSVSVVVTPSTTTLTSLGATVQLQAVSNDAGGNAQTGKTFAWTSLDESVVTVNSSGLATAVGNGTASVTATTDNQTGTVSVTVAQALTTIEVTPVGPLVITEVGATEDLTAVAKDASGSVVTDVTFLWTSDNEAAAIVGDNGTLTTVAEGVTNITASASGVTSNAVVVTVSNPLAEIEVTPVGPLTLNAVGATTSLTAVAKDASDDVIEGITFTWASGDEDAATVASDGTVTAVAEGAANITASALGVTSNTVAVTVSIIQTASIVITPGSGVISGVGQTLELSAEAFDDQGTVISGKQISWSSYISDIAAVDGSTGVVSGVGGGQTVVVAESDGVEAYAVITVRENIPSVNFWADETSGTVVTLLDVWGNPTESIFAVGANGTILHNDGTSWSAQASGATTVLRGVWGLNASEVWAVGDGGTILETSDGGSNWTAQASGTANTLSDIWGAGPNDVFAVGTGGTILHYDDSAWQTMTTPVSTALNGVFGFSSTDVYAVGANGVILHYNGFLWTAMSSGTASALQAVWGRGPTDVFAVGVSGTALRYNGSTWSAGTTNTTDEFKAVGGESHVLAVGVNGVRRRWDGVTWNSEPSASGALNGIWSAPGGRVRAVGDAGLIQLGLSDAVVAVTPDAGTIDALDDQVQLSGEVQDGSANVIASGDIFGWSSSNDLIARVSSTGLVTAVDNGTVTITAAVSGVAGTAFITVQQLAARIAVTPAGADVTALGPQTTFSAAAFDSNDNAISEATFSWGSLNDNVATINSSSGQITVARSGQTTIKASLDDVSGYAVVNAAIAGATPVDVTSRDPSGTSNSLRAAWGIGTDDVWAVGVAGTALNFDGSTWNLTNTGTGGTLTGVWGASPDEVFTTVGTGVLFYDGTGWSESTTGFGNNLHAIWGTAPNDVWASGSGGQVLHLVGNTWATVTSGTTFDLLGIWGASASDVFFVGVEGAVLHWGGSALTAQTSGTAAYLQAVWGAGSSDVFAVGVGGAIIRYNGSSWSTMTSGTTEDLNGVWGSSGSDVYAVGASGTVLHYNGTAWSAVASDYTETISAVWGTPNPAVFFAGDNGLIGRGSRGASLSLDPTSISFDALGSTQAVIGTVTAEGGIDVSAISVVSVMWSSSDDLVATVDNEGVVTSVDNGSATIRATLQGLTSDVGVTVAQVSVGFGVVPSTASIQIGATVALVGGSLDSNDNPILPQPAIKWSSANTGIATVDASSGLVTGVGVGTVVITADDGTSSATASITVVGPNTATTITAGVAHTCALADGGGVYCWGSNDAGELGDGTNDASSSPVQVSGGLTFASVEAGLYHSCALASDASAHCWGNNGNAQLGDNTFTSTNTPVTVLGGLQFAELAGGGFHTCAITPLGVPYCWGGGSSGELGDGTASTQTQPVAVAGGHTFQSIAAGRHHSCGVDLAGSVYCWGYNDSGELGDGTTTQRNSPVLASTPAGMVFRAVSAGEYHTCAVADASDGTDPSAVYCWGQGGSGQLGNASSSQNSTPVKTFGAFQFASVDGGRIHTCAVSTTGAGLCWGSGFSGTLGTGGNSSFNLPTAVSGGLTFEQIATGSQHSCGRTTGGDVYCWGEDSRGGLGTGNPLTTTPALVLSGVTSVANGQHHTCVLNTGGFASCFGEGGIGQLGQGVYQDELVAVAVSGGFTFVSLGAGDAHTCGLETSPGDIYCWGTDSSTRLGTGSAISSTNAPATKVTGGHSFAELAVGRSHNCGLADLGDIYCWGANGNGQLGNNTTATAATPVLVSGGSTYTTVTAGNAFTCALTDAGLADCWGNNGDGQLGNGTQNNQSQVPVAVAGGASFTQIEAGENHVCALQATGAAFCWGRGYSGQVGNNQFNLFTVPQAVAGGFTFTDLVLGQDHSCGIRSNGETLCWGWNNYGTLGDGTFDRRGVPTTVSGSHSFTDLGAWNHTCGVTAGNSLYCWGLNDRGQLGLGHTSSAFTPGIVTGGLTFLTPPPE